MFNTPTPEPPEDSELDYTPVFRSNTQGYIAAGLAYFSLLFAMIYGGNNRFFSDYIDDLCKEGKNRPQIEASVSERIDRIPLRGLVRFLADKTIEEAYNRCFPEENQSL
jgi:hypothetical protein